MESGKKSIEEQKKELAQAYAKYLMENNLKPGDATFISPEDIGVESNLMKPSVAEPDIRYYENKKPEDLNYSNNIPEVLNYNNTPKHHNYDNNTSEVLRNKKSKKTPKKRKKSKTVKTVNKQSGRLALIERSSSAPVFWLDSFADKFSDKFHDFLFSFVKAVGQIFAGYKNSRKTIGAAVLAVCVLSAVMLLIFDRFVVYEYAYNGMVLGYIKNQEEVTNVLSVAGEQLSEINVESDQEIEFVANDNILFKRVVATGKDTDDADTAVNKLAYMTDIEVEASGIYDGDELVTIVKDKKSAERLLEEVKAILSKPDEGMELVSSDFRNAPDIRPIKVLLTSVQSNSLAESQMTSGGDAKYYHLVEEGETVSSIANAFSVKAEDIYDEDSNKVVSVISRGDKVCIHKKVDPVSVEMIETGRMKEIIPYETIRKDSEKYYIGDEVVSVKGVDGVQIFDGTVTKVGGKVTARVSNSMEVLTEKVDEVILVGITERPKTAPTGTFINPMEKGAYIVTSRPGWRWGTTHEGVDMGCPVGTSVYASDGGKVIRAGWYGGYGNCVDIEHANGWITRYGHLSEFKVKEGDEVYQGQLIAYSGNSGHSTGPHLHFETRKNGDFVDPDTKVKGGL